MTHVDVKLVYVEGSKYFIFTYVYLLPCLLYYKRSSTYRERATTAHKQKVHDTFESVREKLLKSLDFKQLHTSMSKWINPRIKKYYIK